MAKILLVTGASSDIGMCLIKNSVHKFDKIICHYRSSKEGIMELISEYGDKIIPLQADFANEEDTYKFVEELSKYNVTHFVHLTSSSGGINCKFTKTKWEDFDAEISISLRSAVLICQSIIPNMTKQKNGKIVFMLSSQIVWEPVKPFSVAYTCSKSALHGLMKSLSADYASKGITVNAVSPSMVDTKFLNIHEITKNQTIESSPLKRLLTPEDVVPAIEFLLSSGADTITGQNLPVMGGA